MKVAVLSSTGLRHFYFGATLAKHFELTLYMAEKKQFEPARVYKNEEEEQILKSWFSLRSAEEEKFFKQSAEVFKQDYKDKIIEVEAGGINADESIEIIKNAAPDAITVFGSSLLNKKFIAAFGRIPIINMHLGLSPYYRGAGTNFWPFYYAELQYVGVTIHEIDEGIDSGDIIVQGRPEIEDNDNPHSIGCKTIVVGANLMVETMRKIQAGNLTSFKQDKKNGRLFKRADFNADHVKVVQQHLDNGLITNYAKNPVNVEIIS